MNMPQVLLIHNEHWKLWLVMNHPMIPSHGSMECLAYPKSSVEKKNRNLCLWCTFIPEKDRKKPSPSKTAVNYIPSIVFGGILWVIAASKKQLLNMMDESWWIWCQRQLDFLLTACLSPSCPSRHQTAPPPDGDADICLGSTWLAAPPRRLGDQLEPSMTKLCGWMGPVSFWEISMLAWKNPTQMPSCGLECVPNFRVSRIWIIPISQFSSGAQPSPKDITWTNFPRTAHQWVMTCEFTCDHHSFERTKHSMISWCHPPMQRVSPFRFIPRVEWAQRRSLCPVWPENDPVGFTGAGGRSQNFSGFIN